MVVVVAEHGVDRQVERPAGVGEHGRLLGLAVRRQVAGEEDDVRLPSSPAKACAIRSRSGSEQWMSPAAATRIVSAIAAHVHLERLSQTAITGYRRRPMAYTPDENFPS